ncbi:transcription factor Adf-1-like [Ornithodoros turicata]|uniref:transcription factor Adf-1-like n=1 Tax=Ornithodoros turicata TaxID=34597 RepID=UPI003138BE23
MAQPSGRFPTGDFIAEIRSYPCLYDESLPTYKDTVLKRSIWCEIGLKFGITGKECESKWKNLQDRCVKHQRSSAGAPNWEYYDLLKGIIGVSGSISQSIITNIPERSSTSTTSSCSSPSTSTAVGVLNLMYEDEQYEEVFVQPDAVLLSSQEASIAEVPSAARKRPQESCSAAGRNKKSKPSNPIDESIQRSLDACSSKLQSIEADKDESYYFCQFIAMRLRELDKSQRREAFHKIEKTMYELELRSGNF